MKQLIINQLELKLTAKIEVFKVKMIQKVDLMEEIYKLIIEILISRTQVKYRSHLIGHQRTLCHTMKVALKLGNIKSKKVLMCINLLAMLLKITLKQMMMMMTMINREDKGILNNNLKNLNLMVKSEEMLMNHITLRIQVEIYK